jgi:Rieske Fe-S protein
MISKYKKELLSAIVIAAVAATLMSSVSVISAQQPGSKSGTIASLQNGKDGKPAWIVSGAWDFKNVNSSSPTFNATFNMVMLNGSAPHKHTITDFKMSGSPTTKGASTTYNGTATVSLKKGPVAGVPVSIKLMGPQAMSLWIDPSKTENHFGNTPIYGTQHRIK